MNNTLRRNHLQKKSTCSPVFVVGSSRSGTTLVYSLLLSSGQFAVYEAETLLLEVCQHKYGRLSKDTNYNKFMADWLQSKQFYRSGLDPAKFKYEAKGHCNSYTEFLEFFMESVMEIQGKRRWAEQTPAHVFHMDTLATAFPFAKFIHVIRDGRDVALSRRKLGWTGTNSKDPLHNLLSAAFSWELCIEKGQTFGGKIGANYKEVKYEDLITNLDKTLKEINEFANVNINNQKIKDCQIGSLKKGNTTSNEDMEGVSNKAIKRWESLLSKEEKEILNIVIGHTLRNLSYDINNYAKSEYYLLLVPTYKVYRYICKLLLRTKRFLRQKTFLGRFSSDTIEIGLQ